MRERRANLWWRIWCRIGSLRRIKRHQRSQPGTNNDYCSGGDIKISDARLLEQSTTNNSIISCQQPVDKTKLKTPNPKHNLLENILHTIHFVSQEMTTSSSTTTTCDIILETANAFVKVLDDELNYVGACEYLDDDISFITPLVNMKGKNDFLQKFPKLHSNKNNHPLFDEFVVNEDDKTVKRNGIKKGCIFYYYIGGNISL